jgi:arginyl-tRNA--protein-N-Asp/Glu arginylyltransferase
MDVGTSSHYPSHPAPVKVPLMVFPEHACSYLPGRMSTSRGFMVGEMPGTVYHHFMDAGFRRSGKLVYQPVCRGCRACVPLRVPVGSFKPSKSQRRCARRNGDLAVIADVPRATAEKFELYRRYVSEWHGRTAEAQGELGTDEGWETFESFLYDSPVDTLEFCYRDPGGRLLAVGICDLCPQSLSSVYFYFDPGETRRGVGTFGAMYEIDFARSQGVPHYYLGYWVLGCSAMEYKSSFRPCEVLGTDGLWRVQNPDPSSDVPVAPRRDPANVGTGT